MKDLSNLHQYQRDAISFILQKQKVFLMLEMGLGKSIIALTAIQQLLQEKKISKVLILAPKSTAENSWTSEYKMWDHTNNLDVQLLKGTRDKKEKIVKQHNYNILVSSYDNLSYINKEKFDLIVFDESSMLKSHKTQRFELCKTLSFFSTYIICMSGTPAPNSTHELWSQTFLIDRGSRLEKGITRFRAKYMQPQSFNKFVYKMRLGADTEVIEAIKDITISMQAKDYLSLPETVYLTHFLELTEYAKKRYLDLKKDCVTEDVIVQNTLAKLQKLTQICSGFIYKEADEIAILHNLKIDYLKEFIDIHTDTDILLFYHYQEDKKRLIDAFSDIIIDIKQEDAVQNWNAGKIRLLIAHPKSAGHGLNLQYNPNKKVIIWYNLDFSLEQYLQANARIARQGNTMPTRILHLIIKNSVEQLIYEALQQKEISQNIILEKLKAQK